jgi:hypothetical protein
MSEALSTAMSAKTNVASCVAPTPSFATGFTALTEAHGDEHAGQRRQPGEVDR